MELGLGFLLTLAVAEEGGGDPAGGGEGEGPRHVDGYPQVAAALETLAEARRLRLHHLLQRRAAATGRRRHPAPVLNEVEAVHQAGDGGGAVGGGHRRRPKRGGGATA